jgi:hypothetical protein
MTRLLVVFLLAIAALADAAPKKKYHYELTAVTVRPEVAADTGARAQPRVEGQVKKAFASHPQLVDKLDDAPDRDKADAYRAYLAKKGVAGSFLVTVEITEARESTEPSDKPNTQRLVVHVALHMLGETIPGRTMGFTGDGQATVKLEVGLKEGKIRDRDHEYAWDQAAELAVADCIKTSLEKLDNPKGK